ncbi:MAG: GDSL family lipase [Paludibacteraceae bacterium]|nr:GDSL family lipase [Paludibacteraceae bacterium]
MKRVFIVLCVLCAMCVQARNTYKADDRRITYVGRTLANADGVSFDYSATYARLTFTGNYVAVSASSVEPIEFNLWIDKPFAAEPDKVIRLDGKNQTLVLYSTPKRDKKEHQLLIQRRVEGEHGITTFHSFDLDGELRQAQGLAERQIEFVGDSYTCGYGSENSVRTDPYTIETQNPAKTYAAILARYFGADYWTISHSGMGIARNYNSKFKGWYMPDRYTQTFDCSKDSAWVASAHPYKPQITVIYLGANDFSTRMQPHIDDYAEHYVQLIKAIKANYGEKHPILCVAPKTSELCITYVCRAAHDCGLENVYYTGVFEGVHLNTNENLGASWHPNYLGHQKIAYSLLPYVATLTGWPVTDDPVK